MALAREVVSCRSLVVGLLIIAALCLWPLCQRTFTADAVAPVPAAQVTPWMLETVRGIGPKTAAPLQSLP